MTRATGGPAPGGRGAAGRGVGVAIPASAQSTREVRLWARVLSWLDRGIRLGPVASGVVHLLIGWLGLQLAFGDQSCQFGQHGGIGSVRIARCPHREPLGSGEVDDGVHPLRRHAQLVDRELDVAATEEVQERVDPAGGRCGP